VKYILHSRSIFILLFLLVFYSFSRSSNFLSFKFSQKDCVFLLQIPKLDNKFLNSFVGREIAWPCKKSCHGFGGTSCLHSQRRRHFLSQSRRHYVSL